MYSVGLFLNWTAFKVSVTRWLQGVNIFIIFINACSKKIFYTHGKFKMHLIGQDRNIRRREHSLWAPR